MRWACALLVLLAGCGGRPVADGDLLLAYEAGNQQHAYGGRVFRDGRYELRSGNSPDWTAYDPFTPEQVAQIDAAIEALHVPDRIAGSDPPPPDAVHATFTLKGRTVEVDEWPRAAPQLEALLDRIADLRKSPPLPSTWRLWSRDRVVALEARCDIAQVEALGPLRDALFMPSPSGSAPGFADPPDGTPLVSVSFGADERVDVFADGRRVDRAGSTTDERALDADRMGAIRAALAGTDWAALPSRLC